jgi:hypothetical protein
MKGLLKMDAGKLRHMVIFCLKHDSGTPEEKKFLQDSSSILSAIPGVKKFEVLRQVSPKNDYDFGLSMEFDDEQSYEKYNTHPSHVDYVEQRWLKEVVRFLEIDFKTS